MLNTILQSAQDTKGGSKLSGERSLGGGSVKSPPTLGNKKVAGTSKDLEGRVESLEAQL
jgi:hypothetical protein